MSQVSVVSAFSDISIDPVIRQKAEKILRDQPVEGDQLEPIIEEGEETNHKLTQGQLQKLDGNLGDAKVQLKSQLSKSVVSKNIS